MNWKAPLPAQSVQPSSGMLLATLFLGRLVIDIDRWSIFALLPAVRQVFLLPESAVGLVVAAQAVPSIAAPALGSLADRWGRKGMLVMGLALLVVAMALMALGVSFSLLLAARFLVGLSGLIVIPNVVAFLGDRFLYPQRGRAVSRVQLSGPLAAILGAPLMTSVLQRYGWRWPFLLLAAVALVALVAVSSRMPAAPMTGLEAARPFQAQAWAVLRGRRVWAAMASAFLASFAVSATFAFYSLWLVQVFQLDLSGVGWTSSVSGAGSLVGIVVAGAISDSLGKKNTMLIGFGLAGLCLLGISWLTTSLYLPLLAAFVFAAAYDMAIVGYNALLPELSPGARSMVTSLGASMLALGSLAGALSAGTLWLHGGFVWVSMMAAAALFLNVLLIQGHIAEVKEAAPAT